MEFFAQGYSETPEDDVDMDDSNIDNKSNTTNTNTNNTNDNNDNNDKKKKSKKKGLPVSQLGGTPSGKNTCTAIIFGKDKSEKLESVRPFDR